MSQTSSNKIEIAEKIHNNNINDEMQDFYDQMQISPNPSFSNLDVCLYEKQESPPSEQIQGQANGSSYSTPYKIKNMLTSSYQDDSHSSQSNNDIHNNDDELEQKQQQDDIEQLIQSDSTSSYSNLIKRIQGNGGESSFHSLLNSDDYFGTSDDKEDIYQEEDDQDELSSTERFDLYQIDPTQSYKQKFNYTIGIEDFLLNCTPNPFSIQTRRNVQKLQSQQQSMNSSSRNQLQLNRKLFNHPYSQQQQQDSIDIPQSYSYSYSQYSNNSQLYFTSPSDTNNSIFIDNGPRKIIKTNSQFQSDYSKPQQSLLQYQQQQQHSLIKSDVINNKNQQQSSQIQLQQNQQSQLQINQSSPQKQLEQNIIQEKKQSLDKIHGIVESKNTQSIKENEKQQKQNEEKNELNKQMKQNDIQQQEIKDGLKISKIGCKCRKSLCLKLYCECFGRGEICGNSCICIECRNTTQYIDQRNNAIKVIELKNPNAFILNNLSLSSQQQQSSSQIINQSLSFNCESRNNSNNNNYVISDILMNEIKKGCNCRKSKCQKKYCECYVYGKQCTSLCQCIDCNNHSDTHSHDQQLQQNQIHENEKEQQKQLQENHLHLNEKQQKLLQNYKLNQSPEDHDDDDNEEYNLSRQSNESNEEQQRMNFNQKQSSSNNMIQNELISVTYNSRQIASSSQKEIKNDNSYNDYFKTNNQNTDQKITKNNDKLIKIKSQSQINKPENNHKSKQQQQYMNNNENEIQLKKLIHLNKIKEQEEEQQFYDKNINKKNKQMKQNNYSSKENNLYQIPRKIIKINQQS